MFVSHALWIPLLRALSRHGIPIRPSRATALIQLAEEMPPAVLAPLLGLHVITALQWRRRAATDWTAYLQARQQAIGRPRQNTSWLALPAGRGTLLRNR
ncbi:hypothetical protein [Streptomyces sp. NPDC001876]|uniref:hypothetical protein n=1 Tax=Streptomyces sp. NPDC001876 TaxID=3154402 RepID=UPI0033316546